jgi:hypothetical protein
MPSLPSVLFDKLPMLMFGHLFSTFLNYGTQYNAPVLYTFKEFNFITR